MNDVICRNEGSHLEVAHLEVFYERNVPGERNAAKINRK